MGLSLATPAAPGHRASRLGANYSPVQQRHEFTGSHDESSNKRLRHWSVCLTRPMNIDTWNEPDISGEKLSGVNYPTLPYPTLLAHGLRRSLREGRASCFHDGVRRV